MNATKSFLLTIAIILAGSSSTKAASTNAIIYDTFGPEPYVRDFRSHLFGWTYSAYPDGGGVGVARAVAAPFSFTGFFYELSSVTLDIRRDGLEAFPNLEIGIYYDLNESPIASLTPIPTFTSGEFEFLTYAFSGSTILASDTQYWISFQPSVYALTNEAYNALYSISASQYLPNGGVAVRELSFPGSGWRDWNTFGGPPPVFRLEGVAIPEPSTFSLLALGTLALLALRRRRK